VFFRVSAIYENNQRQQISEFISCLSAGIHLFIPNEKLLQPLGLKTDNNQPFT